MELRETTVHWKQEGAVLSRSLADVQFADLRSATPWRVVRSFHGQSHYAGWYWAATTGGLVCYESRLELARLLMADHDRSTSWIIAQPFLIETMTARGRRRHVPDFLLFDERAAGTVVDVKPQDQLALPRVAEALAWPKELFAARGWRFEVWSTALAVRLANLRFLAGYRRADRCDPVALALARSRASEAETIGALEVLCANGSTQLLVRPAVLHLVWQDEIHVDLDKPLALDTRLEA